ncbi:phospholipase [bacterium]|nr:MAG: phospholipase [bacterium]
MKTIATSLVHRVLEPEHSVADAHPTLIMLHGRGADEEDLLGLSSFLDDRLLCISARAPFSFPYGGYTWYDIGQVGVPLPGMFDESYAKLVTFVDDVLRNYPVDPSRLYLFGFSMGTVMSYALSLTRPELFRGVSANSGYVPEGTGLRFRWKDLAGKTFFIAHGAGDQVIPVQMARRAKELFAPSHATVDYREYPMDHQISDESLADVAAWFKKLLDAPLATS